MIVMMAISKHENISITNLFVNGKSICCFLRKEKIVSSKALVIIRRVVLLKPKVLLKSSVVKISAAWFGDINLVCIKSKDIVRVRVGEEFKIIIFLMIVL